MLNMRLVKSNKGLLRELLQQVPYRLTALCDTQPTVSKHEINHINNVPDICQLQLKIME